MRLRTGVHGHRQRVCVESWLLERNPLPHWGIESVSAACRSDALPTELHPCPLVVVVGPTALMVIINVFTAHYPSAPGLSNIWTKNNIPDKDRVKFFFEQKLVSLTVSVCLCDTVSRKNDDGGGFFSGKAHQPHHLSVWLSPSKSACLLFCLFWCI